MKLPQLFAGRRGRTERPPRYVVLGTTVPGGIRSVIRSYEEIGFHRGAEYRFIASHVEGSAARRLYQSLKASAQLLRSLLAGQADFVHAHASMNGSFWRKCVFAALTLGFGRPFILHLHGSQFREFYERLPRPGQALVRYTLAKSTHVVVLSDYWRRYVEGLGCTSAVVIPNWVVDKYGDLPISEARNAVLFLGEVGARKGAFDLIHAYRRLADRLGKAALPRLYLAGNGEVERARNLVHELDLEDVAEVVGWTSGERLQRLFAASGVFVLPSYNEGLPMAILEAMNAGMAIVSTPVGGIPDVLHAGNGVLVPAGAPEQLADALSGLIADPVHRQALAQAARADYYARYAPERAVRAMEEIYSTALGRELRPLPQ